METYNWCVISYTRSYTSYNYIVSAPPHSVSSNARMAFGNDGITSVNANTVPVDACM